VVLGNQNPRRNGARQHDAKQEPLENRGGLLVVPRVLFFSDGAFVSSDTTEAGGGFENAATRDGDLTRIMLDDERHEIPDAVVFGG
ncbi:hypothetical protein SAMN05421539_1321, partial [Jannaschia seohaensis]